MSTTPLDQLKKKLKIIILKYIYEQDIEPTDTRQVYAHQMGIWNALVVSGELPDGITYQDFISGMVEGILMNEIL